MRWSVTATVVAQDTKELDEHLERVMDELLTLGADPDITATLAKGIVEIEVIVAKAKDVQEAWVHGMAMIRCALHAAGASTLGWPTLDDIEEPERHPDGTWVVRLRGTSTKDPKLAPV